MRKLASAHQVLIGDPVPGFRGWLATGAGLDATQVTGVSQMWEVLWHLAQQPYDLVIVGPHARDVPAVQLAAMVRTTGLDTPFALVLRWCPSGVRRQASRLGAVEIVDDWSDGGSLRAACDRLLRASPSAAPRRDAPRDKLLGIAARVATGTARNA